MKVFYLVSILALCIACSENNTSSDKTNAQVLGNQISMPEFKSILDSSNVEGSILIYDTEKDQFYSNDFEWADKGQLPASTFKIANSIIALETKVVDNDSTLFQWDGKPRSFPSWEQDLIFRKAFHYSCVPCYQEVAREIGVNRMTQQLNKLDYGNINVDSTNIDMFWLEGKSRISQFQQIDFLKRFYESKLPISERTALIMKKLIVMEENADYKLSGKTGWSISNGNNNGWFVGYIESKNEEYFFATNVEPKASLDMATFPMIRKAVTFSALKQMNIIK